MANFNPLATAGRQFEEAARVQKIMEEEGASTDEHLRAMWAGKSNVLVAVRVRPLLKHDIIKKSCVRILDGKVVIILDPSLGDKQDILRANRNREKQYAFDYAFEPGASQDAVYLHTSKFLIHGVLDGFNATVFAYGQTGSGKTHTMIGSPTDPGIMVRVMEDLFTYSSQAGQQQRVDYRVTVSFLEVYNENIRDLLSETEEYLDLREDPIKGPCVAGITEVEANSSDEIMRLLHQGNARRSQAATAANEVSSRSHAVLQVNVEGKDKASGVVADLKVGKLSLVDLAGSERAANTKNTGVRLVEGANINRSLLALGNCINALGEKGNKGNFVPYRDSKLTRLLKDSLGGNCRTVMIANISASESSYEETLNTLKYANRAKNIKTNVQRNVLNVNYHISEYVQLIDNLRNEIKVLKDQISAQPRIDNIMDINDLSEISSNNNNISIVSNDNVDVKISNKGSIRVVNDLSVDQSAIEQSSIIHGNHILASPMRHATTPLQMLRESLKSAASVGEGREMLQQMRQMIVENFQERMQLRRSLIELEDQNVQNSIEVSKRQLLVVQWCESQGLSPSKIKGNLTLNRADFSAELIAHADNEIKEAWLECEQLRKAILKNNSMKKNIAKRLRHNEREADNIRENMARNVTGEDRRELMELQYQVGRLELENMELEQHRIVHDSVLKGKDLTIQKLKLQLAVRDKIIQRQQFILKEHDLDHKVGYSQLALLEQTLMTDVDLTAAPPSPPRNLNDLGSNGMSNDNGDKNNMLNGNASGYDNNSDDNIEDEDFTSYPFNRNNANGQDWSELKNEESDDNSYDGFSPRVAGNGNGNNANQRGGQLGSIKGKGQKIAVKKVRIAPENNNSSNNNLNLNVQGNNVLPTHMKEQIIGLRSQGVRANRQYRFSDEGNSGNGNGNNSGNNISNTNNGNSNINNNISNSGIPVGFSNDSRVPLRPQIQPLTKKPNLNSNDDSDNEIGILRGNGYNRGPNGGMQRKGYSNNSYEKLEPLPNVSSLSSLSVIEDVEDQTDGFHSNRSDAGNNSYSNNNSNNNSSNNNNNNNNNNSGGSYSYVSNPQPVTNKHAMVHPASNNGGIRTGSQLSSKSVKQQKSKDSYSDDDFLEESMESINSDTENPEVRKSSSNNISSNNSNNNGSVIINNSNANSSNNNSNGGKNGGLAPISEENNAINGKAKIGLLSKVKSKAAQIADPDPPFVANDEPVNRSLLKIKSNRLKNVPKIVPPSDNGTQNAPIMMGVQGRAEIIIPQIGGRNRSLPNLPKQGSGPNSSRSQNGK